MSLFLHNCQVFLDGKVVKTNIVIDDGMIVDITEEKVTTEKYLDAEGLLVIPSPILSHLRTDGTKEGLLDASKRALAAGFATILPVSSGTERLDLATNSAYHLSVSKDNLSLISPSLMSVFVDGLDKEYFSMFKRITVERQSVKESIALIKDTKAKLFLFSLSSEDDLRLLKKYLRGKVFAEFDVAALLDSLKNQDSSLLKYVDDQTIYGLSYDNNDISSVGLFLPKLLDAVHSRKLSLQSVVSLCCENPAKFYGLDGKGEICIGADADLTLIDMNMVKDINGVNLRGWPVGTVVHGNLAYRNGRVLGHFGRMWEFVPKDDVTPKEEPAAIDDEHGGVENVQ